MVSNRRYVDGAMANAIQEAEGKSREYVAPNIRCHIRPPVWCFQHSVYREQQFGGEGAPSSWVAFRVPTLGGYRLVDGRFVKSM